jgi:SAM-dependent methyltransferase
LNWSEAILSKLSDQAYLLTEQYRDAGNLNARIALHTRFSTNSYGWMRWVFDQLDLGPGSRILELGCGPGSLWSTNLNRVPESWEITLSDLSEGMLAEARRSLGGGRAAFEFMVVDAQDIPHGDESFDAVIANHMLYHVPDRERALAEIHRVLRPDGCFYATTLGNAHMRELGDLVHRFEPQAESWHDAIPALPSPGGEGSFVSKAFGLETGFEQLSNWFDNVILRRYEDALEVTEAAPLVAYVLSMTPGPLLDGEQLAQFTRFVKQELASHGSIHITKDSGIFVARR